MNRQFRNLGISAANPAQYLAAFGASLVHASAVPAISRGIRPANGARLAAEATPIPVKLVGDVAALSLINRARQFESAPVLAQRTATIVTRPSITYRNQAPLTTYAPAASAIAHGASFSGSALASGSAIASANAYASGSAIASGSGLAYNASNSYNFNSASASASAIASGSYAAF